MAYPRHSCKQGSLSLRETQSQLPLGLTGPHSLLHRAGSLHFLSLATQTEAALPPFLGSLGSSGVVS